MSDRNIQRVLIPNVTSKANIGDAAMLAVLLKLVKTAYSDARLTLHASQPETYAFESEIVMRPTPYYWAVFENDHLWVRIMRMLQLLLVLVSVMIGWGRVSWWIAAHSVEMQRVLADYERADVIVFVGGGYLRSQPGLTQSLNVLMQLVPFLLADKMKAATIVAPVGFGPFAANWQEKIVAGVLSRMDVVGIREPISWSMLKPYQLSQAVLSHDHALLLEQKQTSTSTDSPIIGFTIRSWLPEGEQQVLEEAYVKALYKLSKKVAVKIQPIVQVDAVKYGDDDRAVTERIIAGLKMRNVVTKKLIRVESVEHAQQVYGSLDLLIGMRMHSNIIAATQGVPFVAVAYEYKTQGIARDLGLESLCLACDKLTSKELEDTLLSAFSNRRHWQAVMGEHLAKIQHQETKRWGKLLVSLSR